MMDMTTWGDDVAHEMREFYEANREGFFERHSQIGRMARQGIVADNLMIGLLNIATRRIREMNAANCENENPAPVVNTAPLRAALVELLGNPSHTRTFLTTREKMHPEGVRLFDEAVNRAQAILTGDAGSDPGRPVPPHGSGP